MNFFVIFVLCLTAVNAAFFSNHSSLSGDFRHLVNSSKSSQISFHGNIQHASNNSRVDQTFFRKNNANASSLYDSKDFVDCTKCELQLPSSSTTGGLTLCRLRSRACQCHHPNAFRRVLV